MEKSIRLDRILSHMGLGTRKEVKKIIRQKRVKIDGEIITASNSQVFPRKQSILVDGAEIHYQEFFYFILNKPQGVISATKDNFHDTVIDLLSPEDRRKEVFPVGRLDIDTEGLLLLTNDGQLAHQLLSPKKEVAKTYYAKVEGHVTQDDVDILAQGVSLGDGYLCMPAQLNIIKASEISEVELTIREGKFHQVKRMMQALGKTVIYLQRIGMGNLKLPRDLALGDYKVATKEELELISMKDKYEKRVQ